MRVDPGSRAHQLVGPRQDQGPVVRAGARPDSGSAGPGTRRPRGGQRVGQLRVVIGPRDDQATLGRRQPRRQPSQGSSSSLRRPATAALNGAVGTSSAAVELEGQVSDKAYDVFYRLKQQTGLSPEMTVEDVDYL